MGASSRADGADRGRYQANEAQGGAVAWNARGVPRRGLWRGLIRFQRDGEEGHFRSGKIFCEDDLQDFRNRLVSFAVFIMSAFLRSTLP